MGFSQLQRARRHSEPLRQVIRCRCWAWLWGNWVVVMNDLQFSFDNLARAFDDARAVQTPQQQEWSKLMLSMLHDIHQESAIYLMVRRHRD